MPNRVKYVGQDNSFFKTTHKDLQQQNKAIIVGRFGSSSLCVSQLKIRRQLNDFPLPVATTSRIYIYLHIAGDNVKFIALFFAPFARQLLCMRATHSCRRQTIHHPPPPTGVHKSKGKWLHFYDCAAIVVVHRRSPFALLRFYHTNISVIINAIKMKKYVVNFMCCLCHSAACCSWSCCCCGCCCGIQYTSFLYSPYKCFRGYKFFPLHLDISRRFPLQLWRRYREYSNSKLLIVA